jgi:shikimate kinase
MILELNGLPGCGKTTVKQEIVAENNDITVIGVAEFRGKNVSGFSKLLLIISRFFIQFLPENFSFYRKCRRLFSNPSVARYGTSSFYEDTISIMYMVYLFHSYRKFKGSYILTDEGILQSLASVCTEKNVSLPALEAVTEQLAALNNSIMLVHCDCNTEESYRRINVRNRNDSAIDKLKGEELAAYLCSYEQQLKVLREKNFKHYISMHIDMCQTVGSQVSLIMERIKK